MKKNLILVRASVSGDWFPNSCMSIVKVHKRRLDVDGLYDVLGISTDATESEIKAAAKKRMMETHPDVGGDEREFEVVLNAYKTLSDAGKRAAYDSLERADSISVTTYRCSVLEEQESETQRACFYKGMSDVLTQQDIDGAYAWMNMVVEAAHEFGASFEIKIGVSDKIGCYLIKDGIAMKPSKAKPDKAMAKTFVLYKMITKEK